MVPTVSLKYFSYLGGTALGEIIEESTPDT
jgi:hypothetical protein